MDLLQVVIILILFLNILLTFSVAKDCVEVKTKLKNMKIDIDINTKISLK